MASKAVAPSKRVAVAPSKAVGNVKAVVVASKAVDQVQAVVVTPSKAVGNVKAVVVTPSKAVGIVKAVVVPSKAVDNVQAVVVTPKKKDGSTVKAMPSFGKKLPKPPKAVIEIHESEDKSTQTKTWDELASDVSLAIDVAALEGRRITWFGFLGN